MARKRSFNPRALASRFSKDAAIPYEPGRGIYGEGTQITIFLPRSRISPEEPEEVICDGRDEFSLRTLLEELFGGCTLDTAFLHGTGYREGVPETNVHRKIVVIASRSPHTRIYFEALRKELEDCSGEEQVLMMRQDIVIV